MITIGFTGTRQSLPSEQRESLRELVRRLDPQQAHHGDCEGADYVFHHICASMQISIVIHPPSIDTHRAYCVATARDQLLRPLPYLERNKNIVNMCDFLIAAPEGEEKTRSGTWSTVRYARKMKKAIYIVYPDGQVTTENLDLTPVTA